MNNRDRFTLWLLQMARLKLKNSKLFLSTLPDSAIDKIMDVLDSCEAAEVSMGTTTICDYVIPDIISDIESEENQAIKTEKPLKRPKYKDILFFRKIRRKVKK